MVFFPLIILPLYHQMLSNTINGCPQNCGDVQIPFPFGFDQHCALPGFQLHCNSSSQPPILFIPTTNLRVLNITNGQLRVNSTPFVAVDCASTARSLARISLPSEGPFTVSGASNRFVAVGCDTVAVVTGDGDGGAAFTGGCVSLCANRSGVSVGCSGVGCCEAVIPEGRRYLTLGAGNMFGYSNVSAFDNCSYAFMVERGGFDFREEDLRKFPQRANIAMSLDWAIDDEGTDGCSNSSFCGDNGYCFPSVRGSGCLCNCSPGFSGNPYLNGIGGCQDVDECSRPESNPCVLGASCRNRVPGYKCKCPFGTNGDGTRDGSGCRKIFQVVEAVLGAVLGIGLMLFCGLWFYLALKQRTMIKLKEQYFRQNGGLLLKQQVSSREGAADCARIFTSEELKHATHDYDDGRILGTGGYGTVYKGVLEDGTTVAIKKSKVMDQSQIDQFINEVVILTQINHRHVVKLLGCCLETEVPMLVYEYIPNGTLYKHIHENDPNSYIPWKDRLRIAIETAEALAYLHSAASMPIFHRDIKSSNILLDENFTSKVSDFGISRLVSLDQSQVPTLVQGTLGYLDPEYFQTSQLTAKSDVYSFGVVLVELLTRQKPISFERKKEDSNLAMYFLSSLKCKDLKDFIAREVMEEGSVEQLRAVTELARRCLLLSGDKRPTMKEVAQELVLIASYGRRGGTQSEEERDSQSNPMFLEAQDSLPSNLSVTFDLVR